MCYSSISLIVCIVVIVVIAAIINGSQTKTTNQYNDNYYTRGYSNIWLEKRKGYEKFSIVGMYYRNLKPSNMGKFEGYAKAEKRNLHDPYAVAIYTDYGKHVGYLPSGNKAIHQLILDNDGSLLAYGYISCDANGNDYIGEVGIKTNTSLNTNNPFYDKNIVIVGRFSINQKELSKELRKLGAYISNTIHPNTDIILIGKNLKSSQLLDKLETLIKEGHNIKKIYKEELEKMLNDNLLNHHQLLPLALP